MNDLLLFFALPIGVIIFSIALEIIFKRPLLVAGIVFSIFLIITFAAFDEGFLVYTILYTILSYTTAYLIRFISRCQNNNWQFKNIRAENIIGNQLTTNQIKSEGINTTSINARTVSGNTLNSTDGNINNLQTDTVEAEVVRANQFETIRNGTNCNCCTNRNRFARCNNCRK